MSKAMSQDLPNTRTRLRTASTRLAGVALLSLTVVACSSKPESRMSFEAIGTDDYRARHPIVTAPAPVGLHVSVPRDAHRLTGAQSAQLHAYARDYMANGHGALEVMVPHDSPNAAAAALVGEHAATVLRAAGARHVVISPVSSGWVTDAPIVLHYEAAGTRVESCGRWPEEGGLPSRSDNTSYHNFGCASQRAMAAMLHNPNDLLHPRAVTPGLSDRRYRVLTRHIAGEPPASDYRTDNDATLQLGTKND